MNKNLFFIIDLSLQIKANKIQQIKKKYLSGFKKVIFTEILVIIYLSLCFYSILKPAYLF